MKDKSKLKNIKFLLILDKATDERLNSIVNDSKITKTSLITNLINEKYYNKDMKLYISDLEKRTKIDMYNKIKEDIEKEIKKIDEPKEIEKYATSEELDKIFGIENENKPIENNAIENKPIENKPIKKFTVGGMLDLFEKY